MVADALTKSLHGTLFKKFADALTGNNNSTIYTIPLEIQPDHKEQTRLCLDSRDLTLDTGRGFTDCSMSERSEVGMEQHLQTLTVGIYSGIVSSRIVLNYVIKKCALIVKQETVNHTFHPSIFYLSIVLVEVSYFFLQESCASLIQHRFKSMKSIE
jgi:hypothetical protein